MTAEAIAIVDLPLVLIREDLSNPQRLGAIFARAGKSDPLLALYRQSSTFELYRWQPSNSRGTRPCRIADFGITYSWQCILSSIPHQFPREDFLARLNTDLGQESTLLRDVLLLVTDKDPYTVRGTMEDFMSLLNAATAFTSRGFELKFALEEKGHTWPSFRHQDKRVRSLLRHALNWFHPVGYRYQVNFSHVAPEPHSIELRGRLGTATGHETLQAVRRIKDFYAAVANDFTTEEISASLRRLEID